MTLERPTRVPDLVRRELPGGEAVASVPATGHAIVLDAIGDAILDLCDGTRSVAAIAAFLRDSLAVPAGADVEADVARIVDGLARARVVVEGSPEARG